jgi:hypothetical protein
MEVRVEHRLKAGETLKPIKMLVDLWAVVEVRTGVVLRWMYSEKDAIVVRDRINNGGEV